MVDDFKQKVLGLWNYNNALFLPLSHVGFEDMLCEFVMVADHRDQRNHGEYCTDLLEVHKSTFYNEYVVILYGLGDGHFVMGLVQGDDKFQVFYNQDVLGEFP